MTGRLQSDSEFWDPGGPQLENAHVNPHLTQIVAKASDVDVVRTPTFEDKDTMWSRTELDSHANMPVVGINCFILSYTDKTAVVSPYTPEYDTKEVPIVDAALLYECRYTGKQYIFVLRNALFVPAMQHNLLVPPFIIRQ